MVFVLYNYITLFPAYRVAGHRCVLSRGLKFVLILSPTSVVYDRQTTQAGSFQR